MADWFSAHVHSHYSALDGMSDVGKLVKRAAALGYPALALTDHGNMAGTTELYVECKKAGIKPFPGVEAYLIDPMLGHDIDHPDMAKAQRYHMGLLALTAKGYRGLTKLVSRSHTRPRFNRFPRMWLPDILEFGETYGDDIAITTGCFFSFVQQMHVHGRVQDAEVFIETLMDRYQHIFVELQHHNITHDEDQKAMILTDDDMVEQLVEFADNLGLPVIATADNHYLTEREKSAHSLMKEMTYGSVEDAFPGDSFHLPGELFVKEHYSDEVWERCLAGSDQLLSLHNLKIPALDKYRPRVPTVDDDAQVTLTELCSNALDFYFDNNKAAARKQKKYEERLIYELGVIDKLGQANYMLLWDKVVQWCRNEHICIEARGSANGSLVCFLVGITQVDPVEWGVTFDRFLSIDRIKPPDIDMDIEDVRRGDLIKYLKTSFDVVQIGTWLEIGTSIDQDGAEKGSVLQTFRTYVAREAEKPYLEWRQANKVPGTNRLPTDAGMAKQAQDDKQLVYATIQDMADVKRYFPQYYPGLRQIAGMGSVYKSYGVHAGGLLLSGDDLKINQWIPTMLVASSDTIVSQFDMDQVEQWGLLKLDVLGQRSLRIMRLTQEMIGRDNPTDFSWIPKDDADAMALLRKSRVGNGIFHAEGYALSNTETVLTPGGWTFIDRLKIGDDVIDPDGGIAKVLGVYPQGKKQLFNVTMSDGAVVEATADHLWNYTINNDGRIRTSSTAELATMLDTTTYQPRLIGFEISDLGRDEDQHVDPYVLGLMLGDGCLTNKSVVRFTTNDVETVDSIEAAYPDLIAVNDPEQPVQWWFRNPVKRGPNSLRQGLIDLDLMGKNAQTKFIPTQYLWASADVRLAVLQGLIDTDGTVRKQGTVRWSSTSIELAQGVEFLIRSLGGKCSTPERFDRGGNQNPIYIIETISFANGVVPVRLQRHLDRYENRQKRWGYTVTKIEESTIDYATCIEVSSASHCFITSHFVVTHNSKAIGFKKMKPKTVRDIILGTALFMPGAMDTGQTERYLERRFHPEKRDRVFYPHPIFKEVLGPTYGALVFQEQTLNILRGLGMDIADINMMFKIVKDSGKGAVERNVQRLAPIRAKFDQLCKDEQVALDKNGTYNRAWEWITGIVAYAFNQAHASGYGIRTYRFAYLKAHYPLEFHTALLIANAGTKKEDQYIREVLHEEIPMLPPDVNISGDNWTLDTQMQAIRKGLLSIPGVGAAAALAIATYAPYKSIDDFCIRCDERAVSGRKNYLRDGTYSGTVKALRDVGAFKSIMKGQNNGARRTR